MKGLILETATEKAAIVKTQGDRLQAVHFLDGGKELSNRLAYDVDLFLKKDHFKPDFIATGIGPGSYTGLRVAASLAQALSFGWKIPLIGFCNLFSFTPSIDFEGITLLDAKMGGVYLFLPKNQEVKKISWELLEETTAPFSQIATPHFASILQKAPFLEKKLQETTINGNLLALICHQQLLQGPNKPFQIIYP